MVLWYANWARLAGGRCGVVAQAAPRAVLYLILGQVSEREKGGVGCGERAGGCGGVAVFEARCGNDADGVPV